MRKMAPPPCALPPAPMNPQACIIGGSASKPEAYADAVEPRIFAQAIHRRKADKTGGGIALGHRLFEPLKCRIQVAETAADLHQHKRLDVLVRISGRELIENLLGLRLPPCDAVRPSQPTQVVGASDQKGSPPFRERQRLRHDGPERRRLNRAPTRCRENRRRY